MAREGIYFSNLIKQSIKFGDGSARSIGLGVGLSESILNGIFLLQYKKISE